VHRDLKPANLFLASHSDGSPLVKVLDFGISKIQSDASADALTQTHEAMGSALYMSPEQIRQSKSVDRRTDIYALGITLFELLSGQPPFLADTFPALCVEIATGTPADLRALRPGLPSELVTVVERAFAREREQRYQSIAELAVALSPFAPSRSRVIIDRIARARDLAGPVARASAGQSLDAPAPVAAASAVSQPGAVTSSSTSVTAFESSKKSSRALVAVLGASVLLAGGAWALFARSNLAAQQTSADLPSAEVPKAGATSPADRLSPEPAPSVEPAPLGSTNAVPQDAQPAPSASAAASASSSNRSLPIRRVSRSKAAPTQGSESSSRGKNPDEYR
jgi:serine/threonine-protein kinase